MPQKKLLELLNLIPSIDDLPAPPARAILHWTGGGPRASNLERGHYHYLIEQPNGATVVGKPVAANMRRLRSTDDYAAHTAGFNSYSVGFSFCGMLNAREGRRFGEFPLTEEQVRVGLRFVAIALREWGLDVTNPAHLFTHYEAQALHGVPQKVKWDITELVFLPGLTKEEVGPWLRDEAARQLAAVDQVLNG